VFALVRIDLPINEYEPEGSVTVKKVFFQEHEALAEVNRLNDLNSDKGCRYFFQITRMVREDDDGLG